MQACLENNKPLLTLAYQLFAAISIEMAKCSKRVHSKMPAVPYCFGGQLGLAAHTATDKNSSG